jgi:hypothetical protein
MMQENAKDSMQMVCPRFLTQCCTHGMFNALSKLLVCVHVIRLLLLLLLLLLSIGALMTKCMAGMASMSAM